MRKSISFLLKVFLGLLLIPILLFSLGWSWLVYNQHYGFSQNGWRYGQQEDLYNNRARMLDDLLAHHLRSGMTRETVIALLGPADEKIIWQLPDHIIIPDSANPAIQNPMMIDSVVSANHLAFWQAHVQPDTFMVYKAGTSAWEYRFLVIRLTGRQLIDWSREEYHDSRNISTSRYSLF